MPSLPRILPSWLLVFHLLILSCIHVHNIVCTASTPPASPGKRKIVVGVDGGTESIRACCFDALDGTVVGISRASAYPTDHPKPGWAEQNPSDWYEQLGASVRGAVESLVQDNKDDDFEICAICLDTTCCSVVFLNDKKEPLRPALLWMDARSAPQTKEILEKCRGDPALDINCGGEGPLSAEWMTCKALWCHQNEPKVWKKAKTICEYQDYLNYKLTGQLVASSCNAAVRWHWNGEECIQEGGGDSDLPGRPMSLYRKLGIPELAQKLPQKCLPMGALVGKLTKEASQHLGLPEDLPVVQGGPDAFVGMVGLGCIHPGQLCLITGSSHLHCVVTSKFTTKSGMWGVYRGAPLPGISFAEGGQSSTGSILRWAKHKIFENNNEESTLSYKDLDDEASTIPPGCDGLVALETFQGSRTPVTDPFARGALLGLTLSHTRAHIWRALMEGVCFGTRACVEGLANAGHKADEIIIAGGATRSPLWLQMHADVTGLPVVVCENGDAPLLGCAVLASVGIGIHETVDQAVNKMVRQERRVEPNTETSQQYNGVYQNVYSKLGKSCSPIAHAIADLRGGGDAKLQSSGNNKDSAPRTTNKVTVSPSLLASDWSDIKGEVKRCLEAGANRLHVDVFDGVFLDSPYALTFGPQMVQAIRLSCDVVEGNLKEKAFLDLHMCVDRPGRYVKPMADAGGSSFIFQWEAMLSSDESDDDEAPRASALEKAMQLAQEIKASGMQCGVSINPATNLEQIYALLETGLIDVVDILAVEPGFGGQAFQEKVLQKMEGLREWRKKSGFHVDILVDGGINQQTSSTVINAGADILVAGTFLFKHPKSLAQGVGELLRDASDVA